MCVESCGEAVDKAKKAEKTEKKLKIVKKAVDNKGNIW